MVLVREVTPDDWEPLREMRLTALREAPYAFGATYAEEAAFTEEHWRDRLSGRRGVTFFGYLPETTSPAGLAGVFRDRDGAADLLSMWVRPAARRHGVGEALVTAAADWAKARDYNALHLWVTETNAPARRLYQRCGFTPTGDWQPLPSDPALAEIRLRRLL
jgi:GNAT superfamily N-acetyltransferase